MTDYRYAYLRPNHYARGWHILCFSSELQIGDVKPLHFFDHDFVIYRGESGRAAVLDAHCPHLGANLSSDGGRMSGDNLICPFHGWKFDPTGRCVDIPYANRMPDKAVNALRGWPVLEKSGFIAIWWDPENSTPEDYVPDISEWGPGAWGDWNFKRSRIRAKACDVIENIVDVAHFPHVHGGKVQSFENKFTERSVTQLSSIQRDENAKMVTPPGLPFDIEEMRNENAGMESEAWGDATYHGPSIMYYYTESRSKELSFKSWWVNYHTPVNQDELDLCSAVIMSSLTEEPLPDEFLQNYPQMAHAAFSQDVVIWKDKIYQIEPILCDGDGPITKLRQWYEKFYLPLN